MSAAARLPDLRRSRSYFLRTARFLCCFRGAIVDQALDAPKRFDPLAAPLGDLSYSRSPDGWECAAPAAMSMQSKAIEGRFMNVLSKSTRHPPDGRTS
jgi:hypothetical protein